jgi:hypothetical protein
VRECTRVCARMQRAREPAFAAKITHIFHGVRELRELRECTGLKRGPGVCARSSPFLFHIRTRSRPRIRAIRAFARLLLLQALSRTPPFAAHSRSFAQKTQGQKPALQIRAIRAHRKTPAFCTIQGWSTFSLHEATASAAST